MSFYPTLSRIGLAEHCVYPWTGELKWPKRGSSSVATSGTALSHVAEVATIWDDAPLDDVADKYGLRGEERRRFKLTAEYLIELLREERERHSMRRPEMALAYNVQTGQARELVQRDQRDFSDVRPGELWGRPDLVYVMMGKLHVRDYKSGWGARGASAREHAQLRACALAAARWHGCSSVVVEFGLLDEYGVHVVGDELDPFALGEIAAGLADVVARIEAAEHPRPTPGRWCHSEYCPVASVCPATKMALAAVTSTSNLRFPLTAHLETVEHATYQRSVLKTLMQALDVYDHAVKVFAETTPLPASNGKVWGKVETTRREIDLSVPAAFEVLRDQLGPMHADAVCDRRTSKAAIQRAVKQIVKKGEGRAKLDTILQALEAAGGIKESTFTKFEEYKP